jgi:hypothetical protein
MSQIQNTNKFDLLGARGRSLQRVLSLDACASTKEDKKRLLLRALNCVYLNQDKYEDTHYVKKFRSFCFCVNPYAGQHQDPMQSYYTYIFNAATGSSYAASMFYC